MTQLKKKKKLPKAILTTCISEWTPKRIIKTDLKLDFCISSMSSPVKSMQF
jgi:hypothetical protein